MVSMYNVFLTGNIKVIIVSNYISLLKVTHNVEVPCKIIMNRQIKENFNLRRIKSLTNNIIYKIIGISNLIIKIISFNRY